MGLGLGLALELGLGLDPNPNREARACTRAARAGRVTGLGRAQLPLRLQHLALELADLRIRAVALLGQRGAQPPGQG